MAAPFIRSLSSYGVTVILSACQKNPMAVMSMGRRQTPWGRTVLT
jgi:hypothetical protein